VSEAAVPAVAVQVGPVVIQRQVQDQLTQLADHLLLIQPEVLEMVQLVAVSMQQTQLQIGGLVVHQVGTLTEQMAVAV
jgi:hypothetical protein